MASSKPTVLFSPGGFHTPWIYDTVRGILSNRGFSTEASDLVSVGTTDASVGMLSDAQHLRSLLTRIIDEDKEIVVVAHSYGGVIVSNAANALSVAQRAAESQKGSILLIVYLAALIILAGKNFWAIADPKSVPWDDPGDGFLVPKNPIHSFYADVETPLANRAVDALKPMSSQVLIDKSTYEPWNQGFEVGYIFTEKDNTLVIDAQKAMFSHFPDGSFSASLASGHSPFLNIPDALADAIQDGIYYVLKKGLST